MSSVDRPVNVLLGPRGFGLSVQQLGELGVKRISVGGALANAASTALLRAARELLDPGSFGSCASWRRASSSTS